MKLDSVGLVVPLSQYVPEQWNELVPSFSFWVWKVIWAFVALLDSVHTSRFLSLSNVTSVMAVPPTITE